MSNGDTTQAKGIEWKWVIAAVIAGLIIVGASYFIVAPTFHSAEIQALVMLVGFVVTGAIIGYFSPGVTIKEPAIGGALVMVLMLALLYIRGAEEIPHSQIINLLLMLLGVGFSWVGGWAGEKLQGDAQSAAEKGATHFQWKWVLTGVVIGFALNVLFVFLLAPVFKINMDVALVAFIVSFIVTGFIVAYKSPGVTLKEPAVAGLITVGIDWVFLRLVLNLSYDTLRPAVLVSGLVIGFLFALLGAWLGEKYQASEEQRKAG